MTAGELVHRTGLDRQIEPLGDLGAIWEENVLRAITMASDELHPPQDETERALRFSQTAAAGAYSAKDMVRVVEKELSKAPREVLSAIGSYFRTPSSDAVSLARAELGTGAGQQRLARFLALWRGRDLRGPLLAKLERWMAAEKELALLMVIVWEAPIRYGAQVTRAARAPTLGALTQSQVRDSFKLSLNLRLRQQTAFLIDSLPAPVLERHLAFWESDAGAWLARARIAAVKKALEQAHEKAADRLAKAADTELWDPAPDGGTLVPERDGGTETAP